MTKKPIVLYVDDEERNLSVFRGYFKFNYEVLTDLSAVEALETLAKNEVHVIITDQRMPGMTGVEFLKETLVKYPNTIRIIVTGYADVNVVVQAINGCDVFRFITKPWKQEELETTIEKALELYNLKKERAELIANLQSTNADLVAANEELEDRVAQRTAELTKMNEVKDKLFAIIGHDLRAPLVSLSGLFTLFNEARDILSAKELNELIDNAGRSLEELLGLLDNLLRWGLSQSGLIEYSPEKVAVKDILEENIRLFTEYASAKQIAVTLVCDEISIETDKNILTYIARNLLNNALKFTPSGGKVALKAKQTPDSVVITVIDTGAGMHADKIQKLLISKGLSETGGEEKGAGLGLWLVKEFVEKIGAKLTIESKIGVGSTFTVILTK